VKVDPEGNKVIKLASAESAAFRGITDSGTYSKTPTWEDTSETASAGVLQENPREVGFFPPPSAQAGRKINPNPFPFFCQNKKNQRFSNKAKRGLGFFSAVFSRG